MSTIEQIGKTFQI